MLQRTLKRPPWLRACWVAVAVVVMATAASPAAATYSILAADPTSGQIGVAVASCVGAFDLAPLLRVVNGVGGVQAQARASYYGQSKLAELLGQGVSPAEALNLVTDPSFDPRQSVRQYAVVDFFGRARAFTGKNDGPWAGDRQGNVVETSYSAQGNLLTGSAVLERLEAGFRSPNACDLAERLMAALVAVAAVSVEGDSRCTPNGLTANSGYLRVADADGNTLLELDERDTGAVEPATLLRAGFDAFRSAQPCGTLPVRRISCE